MKVLLLYPEHGFGQRIRVMAIQQFFTRRQIEFVDCPLPTDFFSGMSFLDKLKGRISGALRFSIFCSQAKKIADNLNSSLENFQIIHAENHEGALIGCFLKEKKGAFLAVDMHGLAVEESLGRNESAVQIATYRAWERYIVERADALYVVSQLMKNYLIEHYSTPAHKIFIIPCGAQIQTKLASFQTTPFKAVYCGGNGYYERVQDFLDCAPLWNQKFPELVKDTAFHHIGAFPENYKKKFAGIQMGVKSRLDALSLIADMQVGFAPSTKDLTRRCASPIKIADYASCGLPILCPDVGEWSENIRAYDAGVLVRESDPELFTNALRELREPEIWAKKSSNCLRMIREKYDWDLVLKPLEEIYKNV